MPIRSNLCSLTCWSVLVCAVAHPASAQPAPDEDANGPDLQAREATLRRGGVQIEPDGARGTSEPNNGWAIPALAVPDYRPNPSDLLREGAAIQRRQGRLFGSPGGASVFVFDRVPGQATPVPMIVMPSVRLAEMERMLVTRESDTTFMVTGEAFVYHGRNYLMPRRFSMVAQEDVIPEEPVPVTTGGDAAEELIRSLRAEIEEPEARQRPVRLPRREIARDGELVTAKLGRVRRSPLGGWEFVTDNGVDAGKTGESRTDDAPLRLLPCLLLESIEEVVTDAVRGVKIVLSGTVHVYDGQSFLLPSTYRLVRADSEGLASGR